MTSHIGVVQMRSSDKLEDNLDCAHKKIQQAADKGVDLIAFPETFLYVGRDNAEKHRVAQSLDGEIVQTFREYADKYDLSILMGSIYEKTPDEPERLYNTSVLINRQGEVSGVYRKIHMCDAPALGYNESAGIKPGNIPVVVDHEIGKIGLTICYDLRFPAWSRNVDNYDLLLYSANWPKPRINAWNTLLKARAIENMSYCIGVNRVGVDAHNYEYSGNSVAIDYLGNELTAICEHKEAILYASLDKEEMYKTRAKLPFLEDRDTFTIN